ncbi:MAG: monovalent cation/H(+) antiporter subunit G [Alphaproteobacteria bacterium]
MAIVVDLISWACILAGVGLLLAGAIGILRMPDFYTRCHAAGVTDTGATLLIILGLVFQAGFSFVSVKLLLILVFLFFTSPTATHALAHAAYTGGMRPKEGADAVAPPEETGP